MKKFKSKMLKGERANFYMNALFEKQPALFLVGNGKSIYLWIGAEDGPCYASLAGSVRLRKLAKAILAEVGE